MGQLNQDPAAKHDPTAAGVSTEDLSKPWYESKAVVGGLVAIASGVAAAFGIVIAPEDQDQIVAIITAIGAAVGGAAAVYGRVTAKTTIK